MTVGFRFHPTDEEIISHYLSLKADEYNFDDIIAEVKLYKLEPWELPELSPMDSDDRVWYFFCRLDYKYTNSKRASRTTKTGYWKSTGKIRDIKARDSGEVIGNKRTLVFYSKGSVGKDFKTNWVIHEYRDKATSSDQRALVLCKLKHKEDEKTENSPGDEGEPSHILPSVVEIETPQWMEQALFGHSLGNGVELDLSSFLQAQNQIEPYQFDFSGDEVEFDLPSFPQPQNQIQIEQLDFSGDEAELADSFLSTPDEVYSEETRRALPNDHRPSKPMSEVCVLDSRETTAKVEESTSQFKESLLGRRPTRLQTVEDLSAISFVRSAPPEEIKSVPRVGVEFPSLRVISKDETFTSLKTGSARRIYEERQMSIPASRLKARETVRKEPEKPKAPEKPKEPGKPKEPELKLRSGISAGKDERGSVNVLETQSSSQMPSPPLVHLINVVVGAVLFVVILWAMLICY